jgi:intraflagellar transport protein 122
MHPSTRARTNAHTRAHTQEEAHKLLGEDAGVEATKGLSSTADHGSSGNVLRLDEGDMIHHMDDAFAAQQMVPNTTIRVDRVTLRRMKNGEVVVREWPNPNIPNQFFRMMDDEVPLMAGDCGHFFEQDEYEMACLEKVRTAPPRLPPA